jgi:hypothetical protein
MFDATEARKTLGIPDTIEIVALLALGYPPIPRPPARTASTRNNRPFGIGGEGPETRLLYFPSFYPYL